MQALCLLSVWGLGKFSWLCCQFFLLQYTIYKGNFSYWWLTVVKLSSINADFNKMFNVKEEAQNSKTPNKAPREPSRSRPGE